MKLRALATIVAFFCSCSLLAQDAEQAIVVSYEEFIRNFSDQGVVYSGRQLPYGMSLLNEIEKNLTQGIPISTRVGRSEYGFGIYADRTLGTPTGPGYRFVLPLSFFENGHPIKAGLKILDIRKLVKAWKPHSVSGNANRLAESTGADIMVLNDKWVVIRDPKSFKLPQNLDALLADNAKRIQAETMPTLERSRLFRLYADIFAQPSRQTSAVLPSPDALRARLQQVLLGTLSTSHASLAERTEAAEALFVIGTSDQKVLTEIGRFLSENGEAIADSYRSVNLNNLLTELGNNRRRSDGILEFLAMLPEKLSLYQQDAMMAQCLIGAPTYQSFWRLHYELSENTVHRSQVVDAILATWDYSPEVIRVLNQAPPANLSFDHNYYMRILKSQAGYEKISAYVLQPELVAQLRPEDFADSDQFVLLKKLYAMDDKALTEQFTLLLQGPDFASIKARLENSNSDVIDVLLDACR